jgi:hypothetical protein
MDADAQLVDMVVWPDEATFNFSNTDNNFMNRSSEYSDIHVDKPVKFLVQCAIQGQCLHTLQTLHTNLFTLSSVYHAFHSSSFRGCLTLTPNTLRILRILTLSSAAAAFHLNDSKSKSYCDRRSVSQ